jgi:peptide-methionine (S)-S-oxide reductase
MKFSIITTILLLQMWSCSGQPDATTNRTLVAKDEIIKSMDSLEVATLGAGCFWCVEAIFQDIKGVKKVESGYSGGSIKNPSYKEVCNGTTGHAEVVQVTFDPKEVAFSSILEVFFSTHDPTTLNRQGADVGTQYRSAIFYHSEEQKKVAEIAKEAAQASGDWSNPIVTEITAYTNFYKAEDYHQDYYNQNGTQPYCQIVITPKIDKFKKKFAALLKEESK